MVVIFVIFIDQLIDYPINRASLMMYCIWRSDDFEECYKMKCVYKTELNPAKDFRMENNSWGRHMASMTFGQKPLGRMYMYLSVECYFSSNPMLVEFL